MNFPVFLAIVTIWVVKTCSPHPLLVGNSSAVRPGDFTYQSVIRFTSNDEVFLLCEGAIIDKKWILTAAGCLDKYESEPERMDVVAGITSTENIESEPHAQVKTVSHINISPLWIDSKKKAGDLALIELLKPFTFNKFVNKATLGVNGTVNETARLIGYGQFSDLSVTELKIISKQECNLETNNDAAELICARQNSSRYAFNDESFAGAPLVNSTNSDSSRDEVIGIVSAKSRHFTSIAYHKTWIENVTKIKSSNTEDTNESDTSDEEESYVSDDGGATDVPNSTKSQTSTTQSTVSGDEDSGEDEDEFESESSETSKEPSKTEDSSEDSTLDESSEETATSSSASEQSEEIEDSDSSEDIATKEDTSEDSTESNSSESQETSTSPSPADNSDESESSDSDDSEASTDSQSTTTTTSSPDTTQTNAPTSTSTPAPTTAKPVSTTETPSTTTSPTSTSQPNATTTTTDPDYDDSDDDDSDDDPTFHNRDQNSHNSFDRDNNNKISPDNSAGSNAVTSNSAQPSNPSFISTMISKSSNLFNSIKKFKTFIVA